jgi:hypothetical protein
MTIRNRELSQFGSFIYIDNDTKDIGISTLSTPFVGIGTTNATSKFHVYGDTKLEGDLNLTGVSTFSSDVNFDTNLNVSGVSTFAGAIDANGDLDVDGQTELDDLNVSGVSTFASNVDLNSDLDVDGQTELDDLNVSGVSTFTGAIDANGDLDVDGQTELDDLNVSGITTTSGLLDINAGGQANTFKVEDLTDNRVVIVGSGGELEDDANLTFNGTQLAVGVDLDVDGHTELDDVNVSGAITATTFTGDLTGNAGTATSLETARDFSITGDFVTAPTVSFDGTGNVSLAATITTDSIELGTYTSGDYVASISGTANQVSVDVTSGEGTTPTISLPNNVELPGDLKVTSGLTTVSSLTLQNTGVAVTAILDEDGLTSDRDDALATQQSIKAYVDDQVDLQDLDVQGDTGGALSIDLDTEILTIAGTTNEIETVGSGNSITVGLSDEVSVITSLTVGSATTITGAGIVAGIVTASLDGNAGTATSLETARDFSITGDFVTAPTVSFDGTGVVALGATLTENSVVLGTYTSGDYVQSISGTANEIEVTGGTGESSTPQIGLPDDVTIGGDLTVTGLTTTNTLYVAGVSTFNGVLNTNSSVSIGDTVNATAYYQNGSLLVDVELQQWEDATGSDIYREFGNVGIGTSTNLAKLSVNGQIESQVTSGTAPFIVQSQTTVENLSAKLLDGKSAPTGSIVGTTDSQTLTTKTINLSNNTLSGTTAEFNTALSDDDFATLNNSVTLTNKTLTSPVITSISNSGTQTVPTGTGTLVSTNSTGIITTGMIDNLTIVNNDISNSANINYSKLNLSGSIVDGDITTGTIANDKLVNSTISGISLGSNLSDLTRGTDVLYSSGTTYNGSSGITISVDSSTAATSNKIVKRDADGGITANDITAGVGYTFYGDGSGITGITADVAVKIATADTSTAASFYPTFVDSNNTPAQYESLYTDGGISYNPSTGDLTVGGFVSATGGFNIGIQSGGIEQTTGVVTAINFIGAGNTFNYNAGTKTIDVSIESGSGGDSLWESYEAGISTTSNVGIGTTNPEAKLSIDVGAGITALDIQGSEGQLFSVTNNLTSGSIFSVNDVSGFPSIDVDADGTIQLALYGGNVGIATTNPTSSLDVNGTLNVTGVSTFQNNIAIGASIYDSNGSPGTDSQVLSNVAGIGVSWIDGGRSVIDILDDIGGSFDGIIVTFNLTKSAVAYTPVNAQSLRVVLGGVVQEPITDYTVSGTQITFTTAPAGGLSISIIAFTATELEAFNASDINSGVLDELYGGTGNTTYATGDILYSSAANTLSKLTVGSASSVLTVSGGVPVWAAPTGGGGGGSGTFDTGITTSIYVSVGSGIGTAQAGLSTSQANNDIFIGPGIAYTFPATAGKSYVIESIQVTNIYNTNLYFTSRHDFDGGENVPTSQRVIIPYQGALELLDQPIIANPSDILNFQAFAGVGTDATGINNGLDSFIVYSEKTDTDYIGTGATIVTTAGTELFTSTTNPSVLQSIRLCNYDLILDVDASVSIYRGGSVGGILTTGVRQGYLVYNLTIPKNSVVEILEKPKYLATNYTIVVGVAGTNTGNSLSATLSGKYIV